ncbi:hypothetical protein EZV62_005298 [Acer yangbiense]|uniref:Protein N-terminal glutamine amidohydrolase n=1 Tax=Acer yangbiense TaxID=1000413 RepID=A0A5C7IM25_9ROSI|nr:hypothetical protein EZV62_005298 [Acer yangbiense]
MGTLKGAYASTGYHLEGLPYEGCLLLFIKCAFKEQEEVKLPNLIKIGGEIVRKCGGVPLAVKTLGSLLYSSRHKIPLWHQKASRRADGVILWDYHAVCIQRKRGGDSPCLVWDLDSSLPFPSSLASYVSETIRPSFQLFSEYRRCFRIVHAPIFLRSFASDRRHMKDPTGNWIAEPPSYEPIVAEDKTMHNLNEYIEIGAKNISTNVGAELINDVSNKKLGVVMNENQLEEFFSQISR